MPPDEYVPEGPYEFAVGGMLRTDPPRIEASPYVAGGMAYYVPAYHTVITNVVDYGNASGVLTYTSIDSPITFQAQSFWGDYYNDTQDLDIMEDVDICLPK